MHLVFWLSFFLLAYVYVGYPILLGLLAKLFPRNHRSQEGFLPSITILISAYNEATVIGDKIENTLRLDYPKSLLEIIVVSDCSSDGTDKIVSEYAARGVRLIRQNVRRGKSCGLNLAVSQARGEVVVFSDANAMYRCDALQNFARHFADPKIGYVVGNAQYLEGLLVSQSARSEGLYGRLEIWLKRKESQFDSVVGGDGAIYAIRRELYSPLLSTDINDFVNPLQIIARGYRGLFDSSIVCFERAADTFGQEFRRKVRIVSRALNAVRRVPGVLNPLRNPRHFWMLASHKLLRWLGAFFLMSALLASLMQSSEAFYLWAAVGQIAFYLIALTGWRMQGRSQSLKLVSLVFYFCVVNLASLIGCVKCFRGNLSSTWTPFRSEIKT
jgi:cellulose synthase/poly-beta-1,6-N-acetylglucosamine synthase-like glycosyltransferase